MIQFYLEGIHCTGCLWLIEKLPELMPHDVATARLDLQNSVADLTFHPKGSIAAAAQYLDQLGYRPHPIFSEHQKQELSKADSRRLLTRTALAGALTGNIMIFAASIYAGATGIIKDYFDWVTLILATPVFVYSAVPLYQNAWSAIRSKRWSVDVPIVLALWAGFVTSVISIVRGGEQNYLDSLSGLVFLLLGSRYFLMRLQKNGVQGTQLSDSFFPVKVFRNGNEYVWVKDLKEGDQIEVPAGLRIPVDGVVVRGQSQIDESILSGESYLKPVRVHEEVFAGSLNADSPLWIRVVSVGDQTRIGKITKEVQQFEVGRNPNLLTAEKVAKGFTLSVLAWSTLVFAYFLFLKQAPVQGFERVLAILIVSCPCAFALATPLALIQAFQILLKRGVYLKDPADIEKVSQIQRIAFDKTGTLTVGVMEVEAVRWDASLTGQQQALYLSALGALAAGSTHPVGKALLRFTDALGVKPAVVADRVTIDGQGIQGTWNGQKIMFFRSALFIADQKVADFLLQDRPKIDSRKVMNALAGRSLDLWILSGDKSGPVKAVARDLGLDENHALANQTPEDKAAWLQSHEHTLFVGDGANDGLALKKAELGIAAQGALEISLKAASIYLTQNSLQGVLDLFVVSDETKKILKRHLIFTIFYNASTITLASMGMLQPLIAAVLMPLSSVLILLSTQIGTRKLRKLK